MSKKIIFAVVVVLLACSGYMVYGATDLPFAFNKDAYLINGGQYDVEILRDSWGVPHIYGKTDADVAYGLAYAHAEDDFATIQESLIMGRARNALYNGPEGAQMDYMVHLLEAQDIVEREYEEQLSPEVRELCEAYADGLNHYAALHPEELVSTDLLPFQGKDVVVGFVFRGPFFHGLDNAVGRLFGPERAREVSEKSEENAVSAALPFDEQDLAASGFSLTNGLEMGSNTFSVSPKRSADGSTFININSHQPWEGMVTWWEAHVHSDEGWEAVGGVFPGTPLILHGHNRNLGWAHTVNRPDLIDIYVLEMNPNNDNQYRLDGEWKDLEVEEVAIPVKIWGPIVWTVKQEVYKSVHGPVVKRPHGTYAIRYAGRGDVRQVEQWFRMNKAKNFEEWKDAMKMRAIPSLNTGYADKDGNIAYIYNARFPNRVPGYDWQKYLPGDKSELIWPLDEYVPFEDLPMVINPESGFVQNCNSTPYETTFGDENPEPEDYPNHFGIETHMTNRAMRALELFQADESITWEEFYAYKHDVQYSEDSFVGQSLAMLDDIPQQEDPDLRQAIDHLKAWDLRVNPENTRAALAILSLQPLFGGDNGPPEPEAFLAKLNEAAANLKKVHGTIDVPWKEVNRLRRGDLDLGLGGGPDILRAVTGDITDDGAHIVGKTGDSYVLLVRWHPDGEVESLSIHQYGSATLDETSPHYADQAEKRFIHMKMKDVWLDRDDIEANLERQYQPGDGA